MIRMPDKRKESQKSLKSNSKRQKIEETSDTEQLSYDPVHFIRSHSKNNDPADIQTQVSRHSYKWTRKTKLLILHS